MLSVAALQQVLPRGAAVFSLTGTFIGIARDGTMPSRATFYRLFDQLSQGRHTTGSARTRRSLANRPDGPFGELRRLSTG